MSWIKRVFGTHFIAHVWLLHGGSVESVLGSGSDVREVMVMVVVMMKLMIMNRTKDCGIIIIISSSSSSSSSHNIICVQLEQQHRQHTPVPALTRPAVRRHLRSTRPV
jgi:hypothetical protein